MICEIGAPGDAMNIKLITQKEAIPLHLLLLADPSRDKIEHYLQNGECYAGVIDGSIMAVMVLVYQAEQRVEIMNLAVDSSFQGHGYGRKLLRFASHLCKTKSIKKLAIATADSSIHQLRLYQSEGFNIRNIEKEYFLKNYAKPIFENGLQAVDQIILEKII